jgi:hypothetical protein
MVTAMPGLGRRHRICCHIGKRAGMFIDLSLFSSIVTFGYRTISFLVIRILLIVWATPRFIGRDDNNFVVFLDFFFGL